MGNLFKFIILPDSIFGEIEEKKTPYIFYCAPCRERVGECERAREKDKVTH
jgi:hypothetical protein